MTRFSTSRGIMYSTPPERGEPTTPDAAADADADAEAEAEAEAATADD